MRKSFIHEYDVRVAMRDNSDGFRAGQFEVRALAAGKHNPCSDFLKYEVAAVQYEPVFAVLELREHGGVSSDDSRRSWHQRLVS
jgi:hypothetical protein